MILDEELKKLQEQIAAWPMERRFVVQQLIEEYLRNREDLRAYQATGLAPESVEAIKLSAMGKAIAEVKEFNGLLVDRLRELAAAGKDGRVAATHCKDCKYGQPWCRDKYACGHPEYELDEGVQTHPADFFCAYGEPKEGREEKS